MIIMMIIRLRSGVKSCIMLEVSSSTLTLSTRLRRACSRFNLNQVIIFISILLFLIIIIIILNVSILINLIIFIKVSKDKDKKLLNYEKIRTVGKGAFGAAVLYRKKDDGLMVVIKVGDDDNANNL